jgi:predicted acetyltransferase
VRASVRPLDDPLEWALVDRRAYRLRARWDEQWLRLVDVDAALRARTYASATAVTVAVTDSLLPANTGTWRIDEQGATRLDDRATAADLSTDVTGVSAAYLGGTSWWLLVASGRVAEQVAGAAARADALFAHRPAPFCGSFF